MSRFLEFDFKEVKAMRDNLRRMESAFPEFISDCLRRLAQRLYVNVLNRTPVDTGLLRKSWKVGAVVKVGSSYAVTIYNIQPYASFVEFGHRTKGGGSFVRGRFFLTLTEKEIERMIPQFLDEYVRRFLNSYMR